MERDTGYSDEVVRILTTRIGLTTRQVLEMVELGLEVDLISEKSELDLRIERILQDYENLKATVAKFTAKLATMEKVRFELEKKRAQQGYSVDPSVTMGLEDINIFIQRSKQYQSDIKLIPIYMSRLEIEILKMKKFKANVTASTLLEVENVINQVGAIINLFG